MPKTELQPISQIIANLPEGISPARFYAQYQEAIRTEAIMAVPVGGSFDIGRRKCKDDLVRIDEAYGRWYAHTLRDMRLHKTRRGVVADAEEVKTGAVDFETLAAQYREQLNQQVRARSATKRPAVKVHKGKPKLPPVMESDKVAFQPQPVAAANAGAAASTAGGEDAPPPHDEDTQEAGGGGDEAANKTAAETAAD